MYDVRFHARLRKEQGVLVGLESPVETPTFPLVGRVLTAGGRASWELIQPRAQLMAALRRRLCWPDTCGEAIGALPRRCLRREFRVHGARRFYPGGQLP